MTKSSFTRLLVLGLCVSTLGLGSARAAYEPKNEFGVLLGLGFPDKEFVGADDDYKPNPLIGLRYGHLFDNERLAWFADGTWGAYKGSTPLGNVAVTTGRLGLEYWFSPEKDARWFLSGGAGWMGFAPATGDDFGRGLVSLGFGRRSQVSEKLAHRWELRADQTVTGSSGLGGKDVLNAQFLLGLTFGAPRTPKDDDGDGVRNKIDQCPGTMSGCVVDAVGCPRDTDQDGVCDGLDRCPDTPAGCPVDAAGCPLDGDGDGVCDGMDKCPDTPKGCKVDASGCPSDSDADGVCDGVDRCPGTVKGCKVDAKGCDVDSDGDGVCDGMDKCPGTPKGAEVDAKGCEVPKEEEIVLKPQEVLVLQGAQFAFDSAALDDGTRETLDKVARGLKRFPEVRVEVSGHTDAKGSDGYNQRLSQKRAQAVADYLVAQGVDASRLVVKGYGESRPTATNDTEEGRAKNRRVELKRL